MDRSAVLLVALAVLLGAGACGQDAGESDGRASSGPSEVRILATDFSFDMPSTVAPGEASIVLENVGDYPHQAILFKLREGTTYEEFKDAVMNDQDEMPKLAETVRGMSIVDPGVTQDPAVEELEPGDYAVACFVHIGTSPRNHGQFGMVESFEVR